MKKLIVLSCLLLFLGVNYVFCQDGKSAGNSTSTKVIFSILDNQGPSWVFKLSDKSQKQLTLEVRTIDNTLAHSYKLPAKDETISKFDVSALPKGNFLVVILENATEVYKGKFNKNY